MAKAAYLAWKRDQVASAFSARGIEIEVAAVVACSGKRRRAALAAEHTQSGVVLGFHQMASHEIVGLSGCPILHPGIVAAFSELKKLAALVVSKKGETRVIATWTDAGLDVVLDDVALKMTAELRAAIASVAANARLARVSVNRDPVYSGLTPALRFGRAEVEPQPGAFLQAVGEIQDAMADAVVDAKGKAKTAADLFAGLGAFTFRLAETARVFAADGDRHAIDALLAGAKKATGLKPIEARVRDLFREPLSATELNAYDCVVFDPPRAGADAQARMLARSKVKTVVAVSCSPAMLARDARTLLDGGYTLESVMPFDQFLYSPHIEVVAVFRR